MNRYYKIDNPPPDSIFFHYNLPWYFGETKKWGLEKLQESSPPPPSIIDEHHILGECSGEHPATGILRSHKKTVLILTSAPFSGVATAGVYFAASIYRKLNPADAPRPLLVSRAMGCRLKFLLPPPTRALAPRPTPAVAFASPPTYFPARA